MGVNLLESGMEVALKRASQHEQSLLPSQHISTTGGGLRLSQSYQIQIGNEAAPQRIQCTLRNSARGGGHRDW